MFVVVGLFLKKGLYAIGTSRDKVFDINDVSLYCIVKLGYRVMPASTMRLSTMRFDSFSHLHYFLHCIL